MIIAIVGPDGCGKTSQAHLLTEKIKEAGGRVTYDRPIYIFMNIFFDHEKTFKYFSPRGIRTGKVKKGMNPFFLKCLVKLTGYFYALLTFTYMRFILSLNRTVVCDRYFYQFFFDLYGLYALSLLRFFPSPDLVFYLKPNLALLRQRQTNSDLQIKTGYFVQLINYFNRLSRKEGFIEIDASLEKGVIGSAIMEKLKGVTGNRI